MPELGEKHECPNCGTRFYDLGKPEPICPRCELNLAEAAQEGGDDSVAPKKKKKAKKAKKKAVKKRSDDDGGEEE